MKKIAALLFLSLMISFSGIADVGRSTYKGDTGTAAVDEHYLDALNKKDAAPDRVKSEVKEESGRNHLDSKEKIQERQVEGRFDRPSK